MANKKTDEEKRHEDEVLGKAPYRVKCTGCGHEQLNGLGGLCVKCSAPVKKIPK